MSNKLDLTVIIPLNKLENDLDKELFGLSIDSIFNQNNQIEAKDIILITNKETKDIIDLQKWFNIEKIYKLL